MKKFNPIFNPLLLMLTLVAFRAQGGEGGADAPLQPSAGATEPSYIEGWKEEDGENTWTWFGMGFESRASMSAEQAAAIGRPGAPVPSKGKGK